MNKRCPRRFASGRTCNAIMEDLGMGQWRCLDCGHRVMMEILDRNFNFRESEQKSKHSVDEKFRYRGKGSIVPCAVKGCNNSMVAGSEMCGKCQRYLRYYNSYKTHKLPPPVAKDEDGRWVKRTARV